MTRNVLVLLALTAAGCASGPRPYDGVLGYEVAHTDKLTRVTYIDDARNGSDETLQKIAQVCSSISKAGQNGAAPVVESEQEYVKEVSYSVAIPSNTISTGTTYAMSGMSETRQAVTENQTGLKEMRLRKMVTVCPD